MTVRGELRIPAVQVLESAVLLQGPAVLDAARLVTHALKAGRYDGITPHPRLLALQRAFETASRSIMAEASWCGHDMSSDVASLSESVVAQPIGTTEAAAMLNMSARQVRRIADQLDGLRVTGGALVFERGAVLAFAASRSTTTPPQEA